MITRNSIIACVYISIVFAFFAFISGVIVGTLFPSKHEDKPLPVVTHTLSEWDIMKLAIAKTESEFDTLAVGRSGDWGILQITPIYVEEVNRILGEKKYIHEDAFNPIKSMEMFEIMQGHHNPRKDIDKAISSHNPTASSAYSVRVRKNMAEIRLYERIRNERLN